MEPFLSPRISAILPLVCLVVLALLMAARAAAAAEPPQKIDQRPWPRMYTVNGTQFSVYRPELDSWNNNQLQARAVMAVKMGSASRRARTRSAMAWCG